MLPRQHRLRSNQEFRRVYRQGRFRAHPLLAMHVLPQPSGQRVGIAVSKKVGGAVERNRVRRRFREIVRVQLPGWQPGIDVVIVARPEAAAAEFEALSGAVAELARRLGLVMPRPDEPPGAAEHR